MVLTNRDLRSSMIFITKRTGRASLRVGAADEAVHVYHRLKVFWMASCCVPRSRNDDACMIMGSALHVTTPFSKNHFLSTSCANFSVTTKIKARH
jgi:hypothetical protein